MRVERSAHAEAGGLHARRRHRGQTVWWVIALLLAVIATALLVGPASPVGRSVAYAAPAPGSGGTKGVFAFTGQLDKNRYGLFMVDVDSSHVWVYEYLPANRKLKLVAARSFLYDQYLDDYANDSPTAAEVKTMLEQQRRIRERLRHGEPADSEPDAASSDAQAPLSAPQDAPIEDEEP